jgi:hypothetical protein
MPAAVIENPSDIARNGKSDLNRRNGDLRPRCYCMRRNDDGLT